MTVSERVQNSLYEMKKKRKGKKNSKLRGKEYLHALPDFSTFLTEKSSVLTKFTNRIADKLWQWGILSDCLLYQGRNRPPHYGRVDGGASVVLLGPSTLNPKELATDCWGLGCIS
jgi:hypothetical protein